MRIYSWNVNGIRAVIRKELWIPFVQAAQPDIICIQETKAQPGEAKIDLPEFQDFWHSAEKKGYSGTALFTRKKPIRVENGLPDDLCKQFALATDGYGDPSNEGRILTAEFDQFHLVNVYTPNAKNDLTRIPLRRDGWDPAFLAYCRRLEETKPVVFCGDLNVAHTELDLANPKPNMGKKGFTVEERAGFQAFVDAGYVDTFRLFKDGNGHYTWWSNATGARARNVGWRIDYFLVSAGLRDKVREANVHPDVMGSDHCPISLVLDL